jgi:hypothetical protein
MLAKTNFGEQRPTRPWVMNRMVQAHVNTVVLSYWSYDLQGSSPMQIDGMTCPWVLDAVQGKPLIVLPTIESGVYPQWQFLHEFPGSTTGLVI